MGDRWSLERVMAALLLLKTKHAHAIDARRTHPQIHTHMDMYAHLAIHRYITVLAL